MKNILLNYNNLNTSILFITKDTQLIEEIQIGKLSNQKNTFYNTKEEYNSSLSKLTKFDIVIFDTRFEENIIEFDSFYNQIENIDMAVILLGNNISQNYLLTRYNKIFSFLPFSINLELIISNIQLCQKYINSKKIINFRDGFYFDYNLREILYNRGIIEFTKAETMIIRLLIENLNEVVTYKELEDYLWRNKKFTKDTLRNKIGHIREKTNKTFISNVSKQGYTILSI